MEDTDLTQREPNNWPLPHTVADAAERGDLQAVKAWLARPTSGIDAMDNCQWTLLHHACLASTPTADHEALAQYLLSRGADTEVVNAAQLTPLTSKVNLQKLCKTPRSTSNTFSGLLETCSRSIWASCTTFAG